MKILYITSLFSPRVGGVEKHVYQVSKALQKKGNRVTIVTEQYGKHLKERETFDGIRVMRFSYPHVRMVGLFVTWLKLFMLRTVIKDADVIHIHDVFVWYLPFRFLYPRKKVFLTVHGYETTDPFSKMSILQKKIAVWMSSGSIGVGKYLEKYYGVKFDLVIYGAVAHNRITNEKIKNYFIYLGRLEEDTGLEKFLEWARKNPKYKIEFLGDGSLRQECESVGKVHGFVVNPSPFLQKAEFCFPGGYLSAIEALSTNCKLKLFWHNKLRRDIWKETPFVGANAAEWAKKQTWDKIADEYLDLYNGI